MRISANRVRLSHGNKIIMRVLTDQDFISGCIDKDAEVQELFAKQYSNLVYKTIRSVLKRDNIPRQRLDVDDLHNLVFTNLFENRCRKLRQFQGKNGCSLSSWIKIITVRIVLISLRRRRDVMTRPEKLFTIDTMGELHAAIPDPLELVEKAEQYQLVEDGVKMLSTREQLFFKFYYIKELSIRKTAEVLGISEANAYTLKHRLIKRLKIKVAKGMSN